MEYCKSCVFYDEEYDTLRQSGDDVFIVGQDEHEKHYCHLHDDHIPTEIVNGDGVCEYRMRIK